MIARPRHLPAPDQLSGERATLGESPRWNAHRGELHWLDIDSGELWSSTLTDARPEVVFRCKPPLGALVHLVDGDALVAVGDAWIRPSDDRRLGALGSATMRYNDAAVDSIGVVWSATMRRDETPAAPGEAALFRVDAAAPTNFGGELSLGNGIAFSPDDRYMYLVDSGRKVVRRTRFDAELGPVGTWEDWVTTDSGLPDGIAVDVEGGVWVACWGAGTVVRFDQLGSRTHVLRVPTAGVTAVTFAGFGLDVLACTTSSQGVPASQDPLAGRVFVAPAPVPGVPLHLARW